MQLTTRDAARLLGVSDSTLHRWLKSGELPATRVNDSVPAEPDRPPRVRRRAQPAHLGRPARRARDGGARSCRASPTRSGPAGSTAASPGTDKSSILREVVERLPLPRPADRELLHRVLLAREALGSTGLGDGIAIPHAAEPHRSANPAAGGGDLLPGSAGRLRRYRREARAHARDDRDPFHARAPAPARPRRRGAARSSRSARSSRRALAPRSSCPRSRGSRPRSRRSAAGGGGEPLPRRAGRSSPPAGSPRSPRRRARASRSRSAARPARPAPRSGSSPPGPRCAPRRWPGSLPGRCRTARSRSGSTRSRPCSPSRCSASGSPPRCSVRATCERTSPAARSARSSSSSTSSSPRWRSSSPRARRSCSSSPGR